MSTIIATANTIERFNPNTKIGLTKAQVKSRIASGLTNIDKSISGKSVSDIIKDNSLTLFNLINVVLAAAILYGGLSDPSAYKNLMFMGVVICNTVIGIGQEIRAKRTVDRLNFISSKSANLIRNCKTGKTKVEKVVLDDIILYSGGQQIIADAVILEGACEVNESLLTGEPDLIPKKSGDMLLSGSYVVNGKCVAKVEHVGASNYASTILKGSKFIKATKSEIMTTVNKIIKWISIAILPIGALLFYRQFVACNYDYSEAIVKTSAALTGMIPEGLVLLTSSILAVGVLRLSKHKVLVQDIYSLETLAKVDTLCLDKTGTITEGTFEIHDVLPENGFSINDVNKALSLLTAVLDDNNETFKTIQKKFLPFKNHEPAEQVIPFSSEKKWSGAYFKHSGSFVIGAAEMIFEKETSAKIQEKTKKHTQEYRVLALARADGEFPSGKMPAGLQLMAFILIKDKIRYSAAKTLAFFDKQGVNLKVISGDNPLTVSKIAQRVDLKNADSYIDVSTLTSKEQLKEAALKYTIFGRVSPSQKQDIIRALKDNGRTVAMVGDGVNDVLAMKESDCSVAMATGSDVARNISHLVLLNSDFASMPKAVAEGRKAINNIQRSSSLFLVKTIYSFLLSILFFIIPAPYPFIQIQMTLISAVTIGIPSFILALEPNREKIKGNLFRNIIDKALPAALTIVTSLLLCVLMYSVFGMTQERYSTLAIIITGFIGILLLHKISVPLNKIRTALIWGVSIAFAVGVIYFNKFFELEPLNWLTILILMLLMLISKIIYDFISKIKIADRKIQFQN